LKADLTLYYKCLHDLVALPVRVQNPFSVFSFQKRENEIRKNGFRFRFSEFSFLKRKFEIRKYEKNPFFRFRIFSLETKKREFKNWQFH
jgi:hypothetical protein